MRKRHQYPPGWKNYRKARNNTWKNRVLALIQRDGMTCGLCGQPLDFNVMPGRPMSITIDHILPKVHGGGNLRSNLHLTHQLCNSTRGDTILFNLEAAE